MGGSEVLGRGGLGINLLGLACVIMSLAFTVLTAGSPANNLGTAVGDALIFGVIAAYGYLTSTTSVEVRGDALVLVRLLSVTSLPWPSVLRVSGENGLEITTKGGQTLTHIGYGSSILGALTGNRRSIRVAGRIKQAMPDQLSLGTTGRATRRPRPGLSLLVVAPLALSALAAVIHQ